MSPKSLKRWLARIADVRGKVDRSIRRPVLRKLNAPNGPGIVPVPAAAPVVASQAAALPPAPAGSTWRVQCKARDTVTGRQCGLLNGHASLHSHPRGQFSRVLAEGEEPIGEPVPDGWRHVGDPMVGV